MFSLRGRIPLGLKSLGLRLIARSKVQRCPASCLGETRKEESWTVENTLSVGKIEILKMTLHFPHREGLHLEVPAPEWVNCYLFLIYIFQFEFVPFNLFEDFLKRFSRPGWLRVGNTKWKFGDRANRRGRQKNERRGFEDSFFIFVFVGIYFGSTFSTKTQRLYNSAGAAFAKIFPTKLFYICYYSFFTQASKRVGEDIKGNREVEKRLGALTNLGKPCIQFSMFSMAIIPFLIPLQHIEKCFVSNYI